MGIYYEGFKEKLYAPHFFSMAFSKVVTSCKLGFMDTLFFDLEACDKAKSDYEHERHSRRDVDSQEDFHNSLSLLVSTRGWKLRNDETIISSISVTDIVFDVYLGKLNYRAIPKVKTWSYFLTIPKEH